MASHISNQEIKRLVFSKGYAIINYTIGGTETYDEFARGCEVSSGIPKHQILWNMQNYCRQHTHNYGCHAPDSVIPSPTLLQIPTASAPFLHKNYTFAFSRFYTRVRQDTIPEDPHNCPEKVKIKFVHMLALGQVDLYNDIPEHCMKHFQPAWSGKPVYLNHIYNTEPVGQHICGFLSKEGGHPMNTDDDSTYKGVPIRFMAYYSLMAIETNKIPGILQMLKGPTLANLDVSIGYISITHIDDEDWVYFDGPERIEDIDNSLCYEGNHMPLEGSIVPRGEGACPGATILFTYSTRVLLNSQQLLNDLFKSDVKRLLGIDWDLSTTYSKRICAVLNKLSRLGKVDSHMRQRVFGRGIRAYMAASSYEDPNSKKNIVVYLAQEKNSVMMASTGQQQPITQGQQPPVAQAQPIPQAQGQPQPPTQNSAVMQENALTFSQNLPQGTNAQGAEHPQQQQQPNTTQVGEPTAMVYSDVIDFQIPDMDGKMYSPVIPEFRREVNRVMDQMKNNLISNITALRELKCIAAEDKAEAKVRQFNQVAKPKFIAEGKEKIRKMGKDPEKPEILKLLESVTNEEGCEFVNALLDRQSVQQFNNQSASAPVQQPLPMQQTQAMSKPPAQTQAQAQPAPLQKTFNGAKSISELLQSQQQQPQQMGVNSMVRGNPHLPPPAPVRKAEMRDGKWIMTNEPCNLPGALDQGLAAATSMVYCFQQKKTDLSGKELMAHLESWAKGNNGQAPARPAGLRIFKKEASINQLEFDPRAPKPIMCRMGEGNPSEHPDFANQFPRGEDFGVSIAPPEKYDFTSRS